MTTDETPQEFEGESEGRGLSLRMLDAFDGKQPIVIGVGFKGDCSYMVVTCDGNGDPELEFFDRRPQTPGVGIPEGTEGNWPEKYLVFRLVEIDGEATA